MTPDNLIDCPYSYQLILRYNGTQFFGWQSQPSGNTVQQELEKTLKKILPRSKSRVLGASRTDSGVHALGQVVRLRTSEKIGDLEAFGRSLSCTLSPHIGLASVAEAAATFHPIADAQSKTYRYRIYRHKYISPFYRDFSWQVWGHLDLDRLQTELKSLVGPHDFFAFCAADSSAKTTTRTLYAATLDSSESPVLDFWFVGNGFLKQMVRSLVGTLVAQGQGKLDLSMKDILAKQDRSVAGPTAPGRGLFLMNIEYGDQPLAFINREIGDRAIRI